MSYMIDTQYSFMSICICNPHVNNLINFRCILIVNSFINLNFNLIIVSPFLHTKMSSVFETCQSMNSVARIMKANQMSKVCASSHEYPHVEKNQESS